MTDTEKDILADFFDSFSNFTQIGEKTELQPIGCFNIVYEVLKTIKKDDYVELLKQMTQAIKKDEDFKFIAFENCYLIIKGTTDKSLRFRSILSGVIANCYNSVNDIIQILQKTSSATLSDNEDVISVFTGAVEKGEFIFKLKEYTERAYFFISELMEKRIVDIVDDKNCSVYYDDLPTRIDPQEQVRWLCVIIVFFILKANYFNKKKNVCF